MITEKRLEDALKYLADTDEENAKANAQVKYLDRLLKRKKALHITGNTSDKSISAKSSYNLRKTLSLLSNIIFNHSVIPISLISITGAIISFFSFSIGIYYIINYILAGVTVPGWTTLVVLLSFFSGYLILMLGILGQYLAKIIKQVSDVEPYTLTDEKEND